MSRIELSKIKKGQEVYVLGKFKAEVVAIDWDRYVVWCEVSEGTASGKPELKEYNIYLLNSRRE